MTQNIRHLAASQRRHYRVTAPLKIMIQGEEYLAANWSLSGFRINEFNRKIKTDEWIDVYVSVPFQGFNIGFSANAEVVRYDPSAGAIGGEFKNLDARSQKMLETFINGIVSGEMETADGIIKRLDVPVTPLSLTQKNTITSTTEEEWRRQKGIRFYAAAAALLAVVLAVVIYTNFFQLKINTAVVMGTNDVINAPTAGTVTYIADLSKEIPAGAPLLSLTDPELNHEINLASLRVKDATIEFHRIKKLLDGEKARLASASNIVSKQWEVASRQVDSLQKDLDTKGVMLKKIRGLLAQGFETNITLQRVQSDYMDTEQRLNQAKLSLVTLEQQLAVVKGGFQVRDQYVQTGMQDMEALAAAAHDKLSVAESELDFLKKQKKRLTITAPADGQLVRVFIPLHSTAKLGDPIAVFERNGKKMIKVFLTQEEALNVIKGQEAKAYMPFSWWSIPVRVADIDYYSLTLHQAQGNFQWQNLLNAAFKTVVVLVEPIGDKSEKAISNIAPGTAATVVF